MTKKSIIFSISLLISIFLNSSSFALAPSLRGIERFDLLQKDGLRLIRSSQFKLASDRFLELLKIGFPKEVVDANKAPIYSNALYAFIKSNAGILDYAVEALYMQSLFESDAKELLKLPKKFETIKAEKRTTPNPQSLIRQATLKDTEANSELVAQIRSKALEALKTIKKSPAPVEDLMIVSYEDLDLQKLYQLATATSLSVPVRVQALNILLNTAEYFFQQFQENQDSANLAMVEASLYYIYSFLSNGQSDGKNRTQIAGDSSLNLQERLDFLRENTANIYAQRDVLSDSASGSGSDTSSAVSDPSNDAVMIVVNGVLYPNYFPILKSLKSKNAPEEYILYIAQKLNVMIDDNESPSFILSAVELLDLFFSSTLANGESLRKALTPILNGILARLQNLDLDAYMSDSSEKNLPAIIKNAHALSTKKAIVQMLSHYIGLTTAVQPREKAIETLLLVMDLDQQSGEAIDDNVFKVFEGSIIKKTRGGVLRKNRMTGEIAHGAAFKNLRAVDAELPMRISAAIGLYSVFNNPNVTADTKGKILQKFIDFVDKQPLTDELDDGNFVLVLLGLLGTQNIDQKYRKQVENLKKRLQQALNIAVAVISIAPMPQGMVYPKAFVPAHAEAQVEKANALLAQLPESDAKVYREGLKAGYSSDFGYYDFVGLVDHESRKVQIDARSLDFIHMLAFVQLREFVRVALHQKQEEVSHEALLYQNLISFAKAGLLEGLKEDLKAMQQQGYFLSLSGDRDKLAVQSLGDLIVVFEGQTEEAFMRVAKGYINFAIQAALGGSAEVEPGSFMDIVLTGVDIQDPSAIQEYLQTLTPEDILSLSLELNSIPWDEISVPFEQSQLATVFDLLLKHARTEDYNKPYAEIPGLGEIRVDVPNYGSQPLMQAAATMLLSMQA